MKKIIRFRVVRYILILGLSVVPHLVYAQVQFLMAWGGNVDASGTTPDICEEAINCKKGTYSDLPGHFKNPTDVAVDSTGNVYVVDEYNHRIQVFDSNGKFKLTWGSKGALGGQFYGPWGIVIDSNDFIYVTDVKNHRVQKFDSNGNFLLALGRNVDTGDTTPDICELAANCQAGTAGGLGGQFNEPLNAAVDANDNLYVADGGNQRIQKLDSNGKFNLAWGGNVDTSGTTHDICETATNCQEGLKGAQDGRFRWPTGVAVDTSGYVFVVDFHRYYVQKFDPSGNFELRWGSKGGLGGQFVGTSDIAADGKNNIYVVGRSFEYDVNHRVQRFDSSGSFILAWGRNVDSSGNTPDLCETAANCQSGKKGTLGGHFNDPVGIAIDSDGNVYVADRSNQRIQKFSIDLN